MAKKISIKAWLKGLHYPYAHVSGKKHAVTFCASGPAYLGEDRQRQLSNLENTLEEFRGVGTKVLGFKRFGEQFRIKMMVEKGAHP